tara:strand:+ start:288 stop:698 length:411 start_codon:yes stop_codon:yes gene_type:complete
MSFFDLFSSAPKAVDNVLDKDNGLISQVGGWIGRMDLTPEEILIQNAKTVNSVQEFARATLDESTERSKSRRGIVEKWIKTQLALVLMVCICAPFDMELAMFYFELATSGLMVMGTTAIIIFHFGSHGIAKFKKKD